MKPFLIRCLFFGAIQVAIGWYLISNGLEPAEEENAYLATILDKKDLLNDDSEPRLILVGGSNVAFGFDSQLLGEQLELKPVNFGLHAALGLFFPLNIVEEHLREGDVVVLSFEYAVMSSTTIDGNPAYVKEVLGYWPGGRAYFDRDFNWKRFLDREALDLLHQWVERGKRRISGKQPRTIPSIYQRRNFNSVGDMTGHHGVPSSGKWRTSSVTVIPSALDRAIERLNSFHEVCISKGVKVYYSSPPAPRERMVDQIVSIENLEQSLRDRMTIPLINTASEMTFPRSEFFDTEYHLTRNAAIQRSRQVANGIRRLETKQASLGTTFR